MTYNLINFEYTRVSLMSVQASLHAPLDLAPWI